MADQADMFLSMFSNGTADGCIPQAEFEQVYREAATAVPNDDYFCKMVSAQWTGASEAADATVKLDNVMHVLGLIR